MPSRSDQTPPLRGDTQDAVVALMARIYSDIRTIEEEFNLLAGAGDFRPRIDYFHDAIQAFTSKSAAAREAGGRLSVELLAYNLACLRYIQSTPLAPFKPHGEPLSPSTELVQVKEGLLPRPKRPDRATRERLSELYQHYAVLFAALLKPFADRDYHDRADDLNREVRELNAIGGQLQALGKGKGDTAQAVALIQQLDDDTLRHLLLTFLQRQRFKRRDELAKLAAALKAQRERKDKEIAGIEAAHLNYVLGQLALYEGSKDMLKKMALKGANLIGAFVEASLAQARREVGR